jgi:hypothetical protein
MCFTLGASIAELGTQPTSTRPASANDLIVSAFPTAGGLYTASAQLVPPKRRAIVGWIVGWLNLFVRFAPNRPLQSGDLLNQAGPDCWRVFHGVRPQ